MPRRREKCEDKYTLGAKNAKFGFKGNFFVFRYLAISQKAVSLHPNMFDRSPYIVNLREAQHADVVLRYVLDSDFFVEMSDGEVLGGQVEVSLRVRLGSADTYSFRYAASGCLQVPCDRCLEPVEIPISFEDTIAVAHGDDSNAEGDLILIPFSQLSYDTAWDIFELTMLNLPLQRVHRLGECNADMLGRFSIEEDSDEDV